MITLKPIPRAELERVAREGFERAFPRGRVSDQKPRNAAAALVVLDAERLAFAYRGVAYELLPVSFEDGVRLNEARAAIAVASDDDRLTPEVARDARRALRLVATLALRYIQPLSPVRRLFWKLRLRRNPYRRATEQEVGQLLGFFLGCRTMSRARFLAI